MTGKDKGVSFTMRFPVPDKILSALKMLTDAGYTACLVGGCVRDDLLGIPPHDYDITTSAVPAEIRRVFRDFRLVLDGEKHGTVSPVIDGELVEITTFRADGDYTDGRHPDTVTFSSRLEDDLVRRDFTVNAMAWSPDRGLIDLFNGREDLQNGVLRAVGDPAARFTEDALRILRGMRFASRLGFAIEDETARKMHDLSDRLSLISRERIFKELTGVLMGEHAMDILREFHDILFEAVPELFPLYMCPQKSVYHIYDVFEHTLHVVDNISPRTALNVWSALLHDCGKPETRTRDRKGFDHFPGHPQAGVRIAERVLRSLKASTSFIRDVMTLVRYHDEPLNGDTARLRLCQVEPELFDSLAALRRADILAHAERVLKDVKAVDAALQRRDRLISEGACISMRQLAVNGRDMEALGLTGPRIGETLEALLLSVVREETPNDREALLSAARALNDR